MISSEFWVDTDIGVSVTVKIPFKVTGGLLIDLFPLYRLTFIIYDCLVFTLVIKAWCCQSFLSFNSLKCWFFLFKLMTFA